MTGIEKAIGQTFKKQAFLKSALTHPSCPDSDELQSLCFQRLEFLGDSIINAFIAFKIYQLFPEANEGLLSRMRSILVSRKILAEIASKLRLKKYLRLGRQEQEQFHLIHEKIMADAYEALVAAIYLDRGQKKADQFLAKSFNLYLNPKKLPQFNVHPKSTLQEYAQKMYGILPFYETKFNLKQRSFKTSVSINKKKKASGAGRTKQEAEAEAARMLIQKLKIKKTSLSITQRKKL